MSEQLQVGERDECDKLNSDLYVSGIGPMYHARITKSEYGPLSYIIAGACNLCHALRVCARLSDSLQLKSHHRWPGLAYEKQ
jgi:hypothetical protein